MAERRTRELAGVGGSRVGGLGFLIANSLPSSAAWTIGLLVGINFTFSVVRALIGAHLLTSVEPRR
jgi:hypothetical protein